MSRVLLTALAMLLCAPTTRADYWISYEANDWPENEGWERHIWGGGAQRSLEEGALALDGRASIDIADIYRMNIPSPPGAGHVFLAEWRLCVSDLTGPRDPHMRVSFYPEGDVTLSYSESAIYSVLEGAWVATFEPGVFHDYSLVTDDMLTYLLYIDGQLAHAGQFVGPWNESRVQWGDGGLGASSLSTWDWVRFGVVVPESSTSLLLGSAGLVAIGARTRRTRRCCNAMV